MFRSDAMTVLAIRSGARAPRPATDRFSTTTRIGKTIGDVMSLGCVDRDMSCADSSGRVVAALGGSAASIWRSAKSSTALVISIRLEARPCGVSRLRSPFPQSLRLSRRFRSSLMQAIGPDDDEDSLTEAEAVKFRGEIMISGAWENKTVEKKVVKNKTVEKTDTEKKVVELQIAQEKLLNDIIRCLGEQNCEEESW